MVAMNQLSTNTLQTIQVEPALRSKASGDSLGAQSDKIASGDVKLSARSASPEVLDQPKANNAAQEKDLVAQISEDQLTLTQMMDELNSQMEESQSYLRFERADNSDQIVITIKDSTTEEVIRQIPSKEFIAISQNITQFLEMQHKLSNKMAMPTGLFANETA